MDESGLGIQAVIVGSTSIIVSLISYFLATSNIVVSPETDAGLQTPATITLVAFSLGLISVIVGVHFILHRESKQLDPEGKTPLSWFSVLSSVLCDKRSNLFFIGSALAYGFVFAIVSGTLVYQSSINFSDTYLTGVPSAMLVTCCDPVGQTPRLVILLTDHLGVLFVPLNIILLVSTSWLVGANLSMVTYAFKDEIVPSRAGWFGGFGVATGLFTACPTCASIFLFGALGTGEGLATILAPTQTAFVATTILLLVGNLVLMGRRLGNLKACAAGGKVVR